MKWPVLRKWFVYESWCGDCGEEFGRFFTERQARRAIGRRWDGGSNHTFNLYYADGSHWDFISFPSDHETPDRYPYAPNPIVDEMFEKHKQAFQEQIKSSRRGGSSA